LSGDTFHGFYDIRALGTHYVLPELSIRADDTLGNHSEYAEEIVVDNTKPWLTMNSAFQMRVAKQSGSIYECSILFSPIGDDAIHEGQPIPSSQPNPPPNPDPPVLQLITVRARVEDRGNWAPGLTVERVSGIAAGSVQLFAIPDTGAPLAVDTDGDTWCDDVNPTLIPTTSVQMSGEALSLQLSQVGKVGFPDYTGPAQQPNPEPSGCNVLGEPNATVPDLLCPFARTKLTYTLQYLNNSTSSMVSAIWTIPPVDGTSNSGCVGFQLDSLNTLPEGPTCFVTRATDAVGNTNVSYPLHVCIDRGGGKCVTWNPSTVANDCTGIWDKVQQKILPGTCREAPPASLSNLHPNPGTFPQDGTEVRQLPKS
jgi:hypothetical protein